MRVIFWVWFLVVATDGIGAAIASARLLRAWREQESKASLFVAVILGGLAIESFLSVVAIVFYTPETISPIRLALSITGRTIKAASCWVFTLYLLGVLFPHKLEPVEEAIETMKNGNGNPPPQ